MQRKLAGIGRLNVELEIEISNFSAAEEVQEIETIEQLKEALKTVVGLKESIEVTVREAGVLKIFLTFSKFKSDKQYVDFLSLSGPSMKDEFVRNLLNNKLIEHGVFKVDEPLGQPENKVSVTIKKEGVKIKEFNWEDKATEPISLLDSKYDFSTVTHLVVDLNELLLYEDLPEIDAFFSKLVKENKTKIFCVLPAFEYVSDEAVLFHLMMQCEMLIWESESLVEFYHAINDTNPKSKILKAKEIYVEENAVRSCLAMLKKERKTTKKLLLINKNEAVKYYEMDHIDNLITKDKKVNFRNYASLSKEIENSANKALLGAFLHCFMIKMSIDDCLRTAVEAHRVVKEDAMLKRKTNQLNYIKTRINHRRLASAMQLEKREADFFLDSTNLKRSQLKDYNALLDSNMRDFFSKRQPSERLKQIGVKKKDFTCYNKPKMFVNFRNQNMEKLYNLEIKRVNQVGKFESLPGLDRSTFMGVTSASYFKKSTNVKEMTGFTRYGKSFQQGI